DWSSDVCSSDLVQQVLLGASDELADRVDTLALEAVVGADREVEVLDRQCQIRGQRSVRGRGTHVDAFGVDVELPRQPEQLHQGLARAGHRVARPDGRLGPDVQDEAVEVGALLDTGRLDLVGDPHDGRVDGVNRNPADLLPRLLVLGGGDVATAPFDRHLHLQLALAVQGRDVHLRVVYLDPGRRSDIGGGDHSRSLLAQVHQYRLVVLRAHHETLEVQDDLGNVLLDAGHGGELVLNTLDADAGHGSTGNRRQQGAAQRVPDGVAEARLQGFKDELGAELGDRLFGQGGTLSDQHGPFLPISPTAARYMTATGRPRGLRDH